MTTFRKLPMAAPYSAATIAGAPAIGSAPRPRVGRAVRIRGALDPGSAVEAPKRQDLALLPRRRVLREREAVLDHDRARPDRPADGRSAVARVVHREER